MRTKNILKRVAGATSAIALLIAFMPGQFAQAAPVPDSCFSTTGTTQITITDYDENGAGCTSDPDIPASIAGGTVVEIGSDAFFMKNLTSVTIPSTVTVIGPSSFEDNDLTSVVIPDSVTLIDDAAFYGNELTSVTIGNSVEIIGYSAFEANNLTSIVIPDSVTSITGAFASNYISSVTLGAGSSLTTIGQGTFSENSIESIVVPSSVTSIDSTSFMFQSSQGRDNTYGQYDLDILWYVRIYTLDPANPNNLQDLYEDETGVFNWDANQDGDFNDNLGGHIINPAKAQISYEDGSGTSLLADQTYTGSGGLESYQVIENSDTDLSRYYRLGSTQTFAAPTISGYPTPVDAAVLLDQITTPYSFVYQTAAAVGATDSVVQTNSSAAGTASSSLASTGESISTYVLTAGLLFLATASFWLIRKRYMI